MLLSNYNVNLWGVGSYEYTEYAVTDSWQEMGLHQGEGREANNLHRTYYPVP